MPLVHDTEDFKKYCYKMCDLGLEPLSYPFVLWLNSIKIFGESGILSKVYEGFHARNSQLHFAYDICQSIFNQHMLIVEAGTGTGKTFAYLLPTILAGKSIMISTRSKALQDQLYNKDIPNILKKLELHDVTYAILKGQDNYLCRYKYEQQLFNSEDGETRTLAHATPLLDHGSFSYADKVSDGSAFSAYDDSFFGAYSSAFASSKSLDSSSDSHKASSQQDLSWQDSDNEPYQGLPSDINKGTSKESFTNALKGLRSQEQDEQTDFNAAAAMVFEPTLEEEAKQSSADKFKSKLSVLLKRNSEQRLAQEAERERLIKEANSRRKRQKYYAQEQDDTKTKQLTAEQLCIPTAIFERTCHEMDTDLLHCSFGLLPANLDPEVKGCVSCSSGECQFKIKNACEFHSRMIELIEQRKNSEEWPQVNSEHCFSLAAYDEAKRRDIVVVNHFLFFGAVESFLRNQQKTAFNDKTHNSAQDGSNARNKREKDDLEKLYSLYESNRKRQRNSLDNSFAKIALPEVLVIDEAHSIIDAARTFFTVQINSKDLSKAINSSYELCEYLDKVRDLKDIVPVLEQNLRKATACLNILLRACELISTEKKIEGYEGFSCSLNKFKYLHNDVNVDMQSPFEFLNCKLVTQSEFLILGAKSKTVESILKIKNLSDLEHFDRTDLSYDQDVPKLKNKLSYHYVDSYKGEKSNVASKYDNTENCKLFELYHHLVTEYLQRAQGSPTNGWPDEYENVLTDEEGKFIKDTFFKAIMADLYLSLKAFKEAIEVNFDRIPKKTKRAVTDAYEKGEFLVHDTEEPTANEEKAKGKGNVPTLFSIARDLNLDIADHLNSITLAMNADCNDSDRKDYKACSIEYKKKYGSGVFNIAICPIDMAPLISATLRALVAQGTSIIITSATMTVDRNFKKMLSDIGLSSDEVVTKIYDSPFDYQKNAVMLTSRDFPDSHEHDRFNIFFEQNDELIKSVKGGIFILTTSNAALNKAYEAAQSRYGKERAVFKQGDDDPSALVELFKKRGNAILVATNSFWEGVDVQGKALSMVIIDKMPFKNVSDGINRAIKSFKYKNNYDGFFTDIYLPDAIISLKQGAGRLIRHEDDKGILVIMDPRLETQKYKDKVMRSLPPMRHVNNVHMAMELIKDYWPNEEELKD